LEMTLQYPWFTHAVAYRTLRLNLSLRAEGPLRIGAGRAAPLAPTDLPVITVKLDGEPVPYIPGSSLKGVLRSSSELLARSSGLDVCMAGDCARGRKIGNTPLGDALDEAIRRQDEDQQIRVLKEFCLVCKLFGSASYRAHIDLLDAFPIKETVKMGLKSGIAINRRSGAVRRGALFQVEYVGPGAVFKTSIIMTNLPNYAVGLLVGALDMIDAGLVGIGGFKSRGFGRVSINYEGLKGLIFQGGSVRELEGLERLSGLDEDDAEVELKPGDPKATLAAFRARWREYAERKRRTG
jgi:CRISPR-associated protein Csm3